ncbi:MAG TPA: hypothetical protein VHT96_01890 [Clostridia bacterium]|nr:hypothetical protein [Clostridia bacterium]
MERIQKLPFLAGCLAAIVTGIASYATGVDSRITYLRMAVMMLVFFLVGIYARNTVLSINEDIEKKKREKERERELEEEQNLLRMKEEQKAAGDNKKPNDHKAGEHQTVPQASQQPSKLDLVADDSDDFKPFDIGKAIKSKVNE